MGILWKVTNKGWERRIGKKKPKYFCDNCLKFFYTGKFWWNDSKIYDDVCPYCGAIGLTFEELGKEYIDLLNDNFNLEKKK